MHEPEKLAGIRREGFDIPALPFGIERIKRKRGFTGAGDARDHNKLVAGDLHVDIFKVVLACTFDDNIFHAGVVYQSVADFIEIYFGA